MNLEPVKERSVRRVYVMHYDDPPAKETILQISRDATLEISPSVANQFMVSIVGETERVQFKNCRYVRVHAPELVPG